MMVVMGNKPSGNQHKSRKVDVLYALNDARTWLKRVATMKVKDPTRTFGFELLCAKHCIEHARRTMAHAPASTRRRWKAGK